VDREGWRKEGTSVNSKEFVAGLMEEMHQLFARLGEIETLEAESDGRVDVVTLLRLALKSELEASELAGLWLPTTPEMDAKMCLAQQCGDEMKHYGMISRRLNELGEDLSGFDPLSDGHSPLYQYLRGLRTTVERIAAGPFTSEAIATVPQRPVRQLLPGGRRRGHRPPLRRGDPAEEQHHHALGRQVLEKYATTPSSRSLRPPPCATRWPSPTSSATWRQDDRRPQHPRFLKDRHGSRNLDRRRPRRGHDGTRHRPRLRPRRLYDFSSTIRFPRPSRRPSPRSTATSPRGWSWAKSRPRTPTAPAAACAPPKPSPTPSARPTSSSRRSRGHGAQDPHVPGGRRQLPRARPSGLKHLGAVDHGDGRRTGRPDRFAGMHFFNPVHVMKLIELVRGLETSRETLDAMTRVGVRMARRSSPSTSPRASSPAGSTP